MSTPEEHLSACLKFQEYYDNTLRKVGMRAPQPVLGTTVNNYRRETLRAHSFRRTTNCIGFSFVASQPMSLIPSRHSFSMPSLSKPTILRTFLLASFVKSKNLMNTENSKPLNGSAKSPL